MTNSTRDLLVEIGTEELPPKALAGLSQAFETLFSEQLKTARLEFTAIKRFATPRRLALLLSGLVDKQADNEVVRFGPAVKAAYDDAGEPTRAASGFAASCGVEVSELGTKEKDGVEKLCFQKHEAGQATISLIPELLQQALAQLPIPKRMRWGSSREEFVRPVHWVTLLFGDELIKGTILGVDSGSSTYGHRFHHNHAIEIGQATDYESLLQETGKVIPDFSARKELIRKQIIAEAEQVGGTVMLDEALLDEVTSLVEFPVALTGQIDDDFLQLPPETLVLTLKSHQKCFCVQDGSGKLLPRFITVSNLVSKDPAQVIEGNERVIRPRLADARFFFETDQQSRLEDRIEKLKSLVFQDKLGTVYDKTQRVAKLSGWIAEQVQGDAQAAVRAAQLSKCDLLTQMVGEFADLQGLMGYYYALQDGESEEVARAIHEQYQPKQAGAPVPETTTGAILAIADKLDTMVAMFAIGQPPTGSKDPFALRRSAIGILRILVEKGISLDMRQCIDQALSTFGALEIDKSTAGQVFDFVLERFKAWYADEGISTEIFQSVLAVKPVSPLDFHMRVQAVSEFSRLDEASALVDANKRVSNILAKHEGSIPESVNESLLMDEAEKDLAALLRDKVVEVTPLFENGSYAQGLLSLTALKTVVDSFFDQVLVMAEDDDTRANRLALLVQLRNQFLRVADISYLHNS